MSKFGQTLKDLAPGLIGGAVGAVSPQAGQSLTNAISMADMFKQRRRTQAIQDERIIREEAREKRSETVHSWQAEEQDFKLDERERMLTARDALVERAPEGTLARDFATYAPGQWAAGEVAAGRANEVRLQGVMDEETFALKVKEINDPNEDSFGQRITAKVRDKDGNVATRYGVPKHLQSGFGAGQLTAKDRYRYQNDYASALTDIRDVFRTTGDIANMRQGMKDRPSLIAELSDEEISQMMPDEYAAAVQKEWDYNSAARAGLLDRERKNQALLDDAINRARTAGAMLGQTPEETYEQISKATGMNIAPGYDPYSDNTSIEGLESGDGETLASLYSDESDEQQ